MEKYQTEAEKTLARLLVKLADAHYTEETNALTAAIKAVTEVIALGKIGLC